MTPQISQRGRIIHEDTESGGIITHPVEKQIDQLSIIRHIRSGYRGMRPVARPYHPLRCALCQRLCKDTDIVIAGGAGL